VVIKKNYSKEHIHSNSEMANSVFSELFSGEKKVLKNSWKKVGKHGKHGVYLKSLKYINYID